MDETFKNRTTNTSNEGNVDIKLRGFWVRGQQTFFDVSVSDPNASGYLNKALRQCYIQNEKEKKRQCSERVLEIDHGSFTPHPLPPSLYSQFMVVLEEHVARFITVW